MQRKLQTLEKGDIDDVDAKASTCGESTHEAYPFGFSKNVLTRGQLRELFSPQEIKKLKLARKRNSQPFASGG